MIAAGDDMMTSSFFFLTHFGFSNHSSTTPLLHYVQVLVLYVCLVLCANQQNLNMKIMTFFFST